MQLYYMIGHVKLNNFLHYSLVSHRVKCLPEVKGKDMDVRMTNSMVHTVCRRATIAATVEPIGLNANIFEQQK